MHGKLEYFCSLLDYYSLSKKTLSKALHSPHLSSTLIHIPLSVRSEVYGLLIQPWMCLSLAPPCVSSKLIPSHKWFMYSSSGRVPTFVLNFNLPVYHLRVFLHFTVTLKPLFYRKAYSSFTETAPTWSYKTFIWVSGIIVLFVHDEHYPNIQTYKLHPLHFCLQIFDLHNWNLLPCWSLVTYNSALCFESFASAFHMGTGSK